MAFTCGFLIGLIFPKCVKFVREHPEAVSNGFQAVKRAFGR